MQRLLFNTSALLFLSAVTFFYIKLPFQSRSIEARSLENSRAENLRVPNWAGDDYAAQISPGGKYLVFQSNRSGPYEDANLWFSINKNHIDRTGQADWSPPLPFFLPMSGASSQSMRTIDGRYILKDPDGAFTINSDGFEGMASLRFEGEKVVEIFFTSLRSEATGRDGYDGLNIYTSVYTNQRWSEPVHLNIINSHFDDRMPRISRDGKTLYFVSNRPGGHGGSDIWFSVRDMSTGDWSEAVNMGNVINTADNEISPGISPRGQTFFFSSDRKGGFGNFDFYVSRYDGFNWSHPLNMGEPFNSDHDDEYITFTDDGLWSYFNSDRLGRDVAGGFDIYRARLPEWLSEPVDILFTGLVLDGRSMQPLGVNATIKIHFEKETLVTHSRFFIKPPETEAYKNFEANLISGRRYRVEVSAPGYEPVELVLDYEGQIPTNRHEHRRIVLNPIIRQEGKKPERKLAIKGVVIDEKTKKVIPYALVAIEINNRKQVSFESDTKGRFNLEVVEGQNYTVTARADGYKPTTLRFVALRNKTDIVIPLEKIPVDPDDPCSSNMQSCLEQVKILFDVNQSFIKPSEMKKLDSVVQVMKLFPQVKIEVLGHADITYRGPQKKSFNFNQKLSERRSQTVRSALIKKGIAPERLITTGQSFLKPSCTAATPECFRLNRRVEFRRVPTGQN